jgi:1-acyl-sn-glycerol-3-phosphate acyltransferase
MSRHPLSFRIIYPFFRTFAWLFFLVLGAPMRRKNAKNVPKSGPLLVLSNHMSNTDPILVQYASPRLLHFMARRELFEWRFLGTFLKWWRAFPISQSTADTEAIRRAIELINEGNAVCIFPEGQLSPDGKLVELLPGAHLIVRRTETTCICVGLQGTNKLMPHPKMTPQFAKSWLTAKWGEPRKFTKADSREDFMNWLESELKKLSDQ